jgi:uncharacterized membrane protein
MARPQHAARQEPATQAEARETSRDAPSRRRVVAGDSFNEEKLAKRLGWFGIALGLAEVVAPRSFAKRIGVRGGIPLLTAFGLREIATGVGILSRHRPVGWLWARIAGDLLDLAALRAAVRTTSDSRVRANATAASAAVTAVTALDVICALRLTRGGATARSLPRDRAIRIETGILVNLPAAQCYGFWRDLENLPRFMSHLESVKQNDGRSHWVAKGPAGTTVEWDAEIINDEPEHLIAWRSLDGADVDSTGSVHFEPTPGGRGTIVRVKMNYRPPAGIVGATMAELLGENPEREVSEDMRRFKRLVEAR